MSIVAGVDFGTLSVRVSIFDSVKGRLGSGTAEYPLLRKKEDPTTPRRATPITCARWPRPRAAPSRTPASTAQAIEAIALDTTGSSVIPGGRATCEPIDDYYLWCDHRAWREAAEITAAAHASQSGRDRLVRRHLLVASGASPNCCTGCATIPRSARASPPRWSIATWWPPCSAASPIPRRCRAASAPWATSGCGTPRWAGCLRKSFLTGRRSAARRRSRESWAGATPPATRSPGTSRAEWAAKLGLRAGIPIPVGAFDAHWDAIGAGVPHRRRGQRGGHFHLHHGDQRPARA